MTLSGTEIRCVEPFSIFKKGVVVYCFAEEEDGFWISSPLIESAYGTPQMQLPLHRKKNFIPR